MSVETTVPRQATDDEHDPRWYLRSIWPLVFAIPLASVIGGIGVYTAANYHADALIKDPERPDLSARHADPVPDEAAVRHGISARLTLEGTRLRLVLAGDAGAAPEVILVGFANATQETDDERSTVHRTAPGVYEAPAPALGSGPWYLEATPPGRGWRVVGRLADDGATTLEPYRAQ